jgi:hypothetical protein
MTSDPNNTIIPDSTKVLTVMFFFCTAWIELAGLFVFIALTRSYFSKEMQGMLMVHERRISLMQRDIDVHAYMCRTSLEYSHHLFPTSPPRAQQERRRSESQLHSVDLTSRRSPEEKYPSEPLRRTKTSSRHFILQKQPSSHTLSDDVSNDGEIRDDDSFV